MVVRPHARGSTLRHRRHQVSRIKPSLSSSHGIPVKQRRCDPVRIHPPQLRPRTYMSVPPRWEHMLILQQPPAKEVQVPPSREPIIPSVQTHVRDVYLFQSLAPWHTPWSDLAIPNPDGLGHLDTADSDLMHHQYRLSALQWNPGPARRNPTNIITATCGRFHVVMLQEASDQSLTHITDQFIAHTGNTDLAILLDKDTFEPDPVVFAFKEDSTSIGTWGMVLLIVRGLLRRPSLSGTPTATFCSVHIHNVVVKKRDASTQAHHSELAFWRMIRETEFHFLS